MGEMIFIVEFCDLVAVGVNAAVKMPVRGPNALVESRVGSPRKHISSALSKALSACCGRLRRSRSDLQRRGRGGL